MKEIIGPLRQGMRLIGFVWWLPLVLPSLGLLLSMAPLWRDSDGFLQVTGKIGGLTLLHWPPLFCLAARIPLAIGSWFEGVPFSFSQPSLCDSGVLLLLWTQHTLLLLAAGWVIACITEQVTVRVLLSTVFALAGVPFYAFAHSVGSESLSNTIQLALTANVILLLKGPGGWHWAGYAVLLTLAILTRHINAVFAALLPVALIIEILSAACSVPKFPSLQRLLPFALAIACGIAAILGAKLSVRMLCAASKTPYYSRIGYTFQYRLEFLKMATPDERKRFFNAASGALKSRLAQEAMRSYEAAIAAGTCTNAEFLGLEVRALVKKTSTKKSLRIEENRVLNQIATAILLHPPQAFQEVVARDFFKMFELSPADIAENALDATEAIDQWLGQEKFAILRPLSTFHDGFSGGKMARSFRSNLWVNFLRPIPLWVFAILALLAWLVTGFTCRDKPWQFALPPALLFTGGLLYLLNCTNTYFAPRFGLPLYEATLSALMISAGFLAEILARNKPKLGIGGDDIAQGAGRWGSRNP